IFSLWNHLGAGETRPIAEWAAEHFERAGRPLRIAVDEPLWRYQNLSEAKEAEIKRTSPGSHPREKRIIERVVDLLKLNVQLLFVFDGPHKARKIRRANSGYVGQPSNEAIRLLTNIFDYMGVPYHNAPGDAEAECVRLEQLGVVDAVWSDDSDCLMFGCSTLVRF
ncbi:PIN domain-like protein, partial [Rhizodiscina lignyota]